MTTVIPPTARTGRRFRRLGRRADGEAGFTLVELVIALTVLTVGILATLASFSSGFVALNRAKATTSASALEDAQMERFRALTFASICLSNTSSDSTHVADTPTGTAVPTCSTSDPALVAVRNPTTGPDNRQYRVDTYVVWTCTTGTLSVTTPYSTSAPGCVTSGVAVSAPVKLVRVVVRGSTATPVKVQEESTFDQTTGT